MNAANKGARLLAQIFLSMGGAIPAPKVDAPFNADDIEMDWECLRRHPKYQQAWDRNQILKKKMNALLSKRKSQRNGVIRPGTKAHTMATLVATDSFANFFEQWGVFPVDPSKAFAGLSQFEKNNLSLRFGGSGKTEIKQGSLDLQTQAILKAEALKQGIVPPSNFKIEMIPIDASDSRLTRDKNVFRLQILAWDMRQRNTNWLAIGRELKKRSVPCGNGSDAALISTARNYYEGARRHIENGPWRRIAKTET